MINERKKGGRQKGRKDISYTNKNAGRSERNRGKATEEGTKKFKRQKEGIKAGMKGKKKDERKVTEKEC